MRNRREIFTCLGLSTKEKNLGQRRSGQGIRDVGWWDILNKERKKGGKKGKSKR